MSAVLLLWSQKFATMLGLFTVRAGAFLGPTQIFTRTTWARGRRIVRAEPPAPQIQSERKAAIRVTVFDAAISGTAFTFGAWRFAKPELTNTAATIAFVFAWYEIWFYFTHRLLHHHALYRFHAQHHVARITTPVSALSFSLFERATLQLGAVGATALFSRYLPITQPGIAIYFSLNLFLNIYGHSNVEWLPAGFPRSFLGRIFISPSYHALHHARMSGHYGLFTQTLDRVLGTYFGDYPEVHALASNPKLTGE